MKKLKVVKCRQSIEGRSAVEGNKYNKDNDKRLKEKGFSTLKLATLLGIFVSLKWGLDVGNFILDLLKIEKERS